MLRAPAFTRGRRGSILVVLALSFGSWCSTTATAQNKSLRHREIGVQMDVQPDGRVLITEVWDCILDGRLNGGFRAIPLQGHQKITNVALTEGRNDDGATEYRVFEGDSEANIPKHSCRVDRGWTETDIRWRSRAESEPPYQGKSARFTIRYTLHGAFRPYPNLDELWWKPILGQREHTLRRVSCTVRLPSDPGDFGVELLCENPTAKWFTHGQPPQVMFFARSLAPDELFEIRIKLPKGIVEPQWGIAALMSGIGGVVILFGGMLFVGGVSFVRWRRSGRDPRPTFAPSLQAGPPSELKPGAVSALLNEKADIRCVTATLLDLGRRGVLTIDQEDEDEANYRFTLERYEPNELDSVEQKLIKGLFGSKPKPGDVRGSDDLRNSFYKTAERIQKSIWKCVLDAGFFVGDPSSIVRRNALAGVGIALLGMVLVALSSPPHGFLVFWGIFFGGIPLMILLATWAGSKSIGAKIFMTLFLGAFSAIGLGAIGYSLFTTWAEGARPILHIPGFVLIAAGIITLVLAPTMARRTQSGADETARWRSFGDFLATSRAFRTTDLNGRDFGKYLPFAVALGVERAWADRFGAISAAELPDYYRPTNFHHLGSSAGGTSLGSVGDSLSSGVSSMVNSIGNTFASSPSSSGSSGGGSSGGGGGGGGGSGGGW